ncbi:MAG: glycosyltransferase family 2 protein [Bacteroidaceae bacterium]|nr:glycosyltransferase family 2 protein [Bacteroidaceae bacterium]
MEISVIIPTYHPKEYTVECLDSLKKQTLDSQCFEVLVILNGEHDPYYSFLQQSLPENGKILYSPVASACSSRNMGLDNALGEYICFIDDDDKISPTYLEELLKCAHKDVIAASNCLSFYEDGHTEKNSYSREFERHVGLGVQPFYRPKKIFSVPWMKLIHRDIIGNRRFNGSFPSGQDALLMFEISDEMDKVRFTSSNAIYYWRQRSNSLHRIGHLKRISKYSKLSWAYIGLYFHRPQKYNSYFFLTRLLASCHAILVGK